MIYYIHMNYQDINKKNISKWESTLKYLVSVLDRNNIKYYISASGLHYIQGSNIYPYDIDLFIHKDNIPIVYDLLKQYSISNIHKWENKLLEFQGEYNGIPFEICEWEKGPKEILKLKFKETEISIIN